MTPLSSRTALKEWPSAIAALAAGRQVILLRKGGIAERDFVLDAHRFLLMPSWFHDGGNAPQELLISHWSQVLQVWTTASLEMILRLESQVVLSREDLEKRHHFRPGQALHVIGVQTFELPVPVRIPMRPDYQGCRSWVTLDDAVDLANSRPAVAESAVDERLQEIGTLLR